MGLLGGQGWCLVVCIRRSLSRAGRDALFGKGWCWVGWMSSCKTVVSPDGAHARSYLISSSLYALSNGWAVIAYVML
jgi:hypothetical protein